MIPTVKAASNTPILQQNRRCSQETIQIILYYFLQLPLYDIMQWLPYSSVLLYSYIGYVTETDGEK